MPEVRVVEDRDLHRDAFGRRGHELLRGHLEAAVAVDRPHHAIGPADLGADRGRHRVAHRAEPTGVDPRVRQLELPQLARPHLVLADTGHEDAVVGRVARAASRCTNCGFSGPPSSCVYLSGNCSCHVAQRREPLRRGRARRASSCSDFTALISSLMTILQSPTIGTSAAGPCRARPDRCRRG